MNTEATSVITPEQQAIFDKALEGLVGETYEPVAVLATQVVSGTNYAFLAKGTKVTAEPVNEWVVVTVYHNLQDEASVTSINSIDLTGIKTLENSTDTTGMTGAWAIAEFAANALPEDAQKAFDTAVQKHVGVDLKPIALLGSQLVAGTNYYVLCGGAPVVANPQPELYVVEIFADLEGGAEFSEVKVFDLLGYIGEQAA